MRSSRSRGSAVTTRVFPYLVIVALSMFAACQASAQIWHAPTAATGYKANTPHEVQSGAATLVEHYNPNQMLRLTIGLQPPHVAEERQFLTDVQTKGSHDFHQFLSAEEWSKRFDPSEADEQAVVDWATSQGFTITRRFPNRLLVDVEAPASTIERALAVTINRYQLGTKLFFSNDRDAVIPAKLTGIIQSVGGLNNLQMLTPANRSLVEPDFPDYSPGPAYSEGASTHQDGSRSKLTAAMKASRAKAAPSNGVVHDITGGAYDPTDIYSSQAYDANALYHLGHCCNPANLSGGSPPESSIAIATFGAQQNSDMQGFHNQYPYLAYYWFQINVDGTPACCDGEGTMDLEWSTAMANSFGSYLNTAKVFMYDGTSPTFGQSNDIYNTMLSNGYARNFSTSWGCREYYCYDAADMNTADAIFSSMVGQGWSLTAASGDQGATAGCGDAIAIQFPSSDPNVVGAGGTTMYLSSGPIFSSQGAWSGGPDGCASNDGGSTGGYSVWWGTPSYQSPLGIGTRGVPDIALNADWYHTPQNLYFLGSLSGNGGTSIVAPETVGFFAQENAYLLALGNICGGGGSPCAPMGSVNPYLYTEGIYQGAPHYPFYDITSGCNNNDITSLYGLGFYCAGSGWDPVTGWGSYNFLQLAWAINWYHVPGYSYPVVNFSGPATSQWYNTDQIVSWTVTTPPANSYPSPGTSGFSQAWDSDPGDVYSEAVPGAGNSFYSGPQYANATAGCLDFTGGSCAGGVSQGWHYAYVRAWGNEGEHAGAYIYGPVGYDTVAPVTTGSVSGTLSGGYYVNTATVTLSATDATSGVAHTYYQVDGGAVTTYGGAFGVSTIGSHTVTFHSVDNAGNVEGTKSVSFSVISTTATGLVSSLNPAPTGKAVKFTAKVTATDGGTPTGIVTFRDGSTVLANKTLLGGIATYSSTKLAFGSHSITATYNGLSGNYLSSASSTLVEKILNATTTALTSSPNPSTVGQAVTFKATVSHTASGTATGTVTFKKGATVLATVALPASGVATFVTSTLKKGTNTIKAYYTGDANFYPSTSAGDAQVVNP